MSGRLIAAVGLGWCIAGCAVLPQNWRVLKRPVVTGISVALVEQTDQGARLVANVELSNFNETALPLVWCQYRITVDGGDTFAMADELHRTLLARGTQIVQLPAAMAAAALDLAGASYTIKGAITYEPPGAIRKVLTESKIPLPAVHFQSSGELE